MENQEKSYKSLVIIELVVTIIGLATDIFVLIGRTLLLNSLLVFAIYICIIYYSFYGYKIPHGNLLKKIYLVFSFSLVVCAISNSAYLVIPPYLMAVSAVIIAFIGGRLNRVSENLKFSAVIFVLMVVACALSIPPSYSGVLPEGLTAEDANRRVALFYLLVSQTISWASLFMTYLVRYYRHKLVGLDEE